MQGGMALTIVGNPDAVVGGVDTHADVHVAAVVNHLGGVLGVESFTTTSNGYRQLVSWLRSHGELVLVGVEGTGSYGVGVSRYLQHEGVTVVEVDRPNRQTRHRKGKSDPVDALAAARAALSGSATGSPKTRDGNVEAIRVLMIARRSAVDARIETLNQLRHVVFHRHTGDQIHVLRVDRYRTGQQSLDVAAAGGRRSGSLHHIHDHPGSRPSGPVFA
jgi:transposase